MENLNEINGKSGKKETSLIVLALIAIPGLLLLEFFPQYVSSLYEGHVEKLLYANYSLLYVFYAFVLITLTFLAIGSIMKAWMYVTFNWKPSTAYLAGEAGSISSKDGDSGEKNKKQVGTSQE
jgi:hypothetical protein